VNSPYSRVFNIIARRTLPAYCALYPLAAVALQQWYAERLYQDFATFNQLKAAFPSVSLVGDDRAVFNIMGNRYRLVVRFAFAYKTIQIKWFGTHRDYDHVDVATVQYRPL